MPPTITAIYASLLALLFLALSAWVILGRFRHRVSVGDGGETDMLKRMRVQANCAEYAPIGILMLGLAELQGMAPGALHLFGLCLLAGRIAHAVGMGRTPQVPALRIGGMVLSIAPIALCAVGNLFLALS